MSKAIQFLKETRTEMKLVKWPSREKALLYTAVVIILSIGLGYMLGGFDALLQTALKSIILK